MIEATFIASGKTMLEALNFTPSLVSKIMFGDGNFRQVKKIDIFCNNVDDANLLDNISPRVAISYALTENKQWKFNASVGRYFKIPTYTMLGFQNKGGAFINQQAAYTKSDHFVAGIEYNLTPASRFTVEGFVKNYANYPISVIDGVSLANKGGGFEVLGNEEIDAEGEGQSKGIEILFQQKLSKNFYGAVSYTHLRAHET